MKMKWMGCIPLLLLLVPCQSFIVTDLIEVYVDQNAGVIENYTYNYNVSGLGLIFPRLMF